MWSGGGGVEGGGGTFKLKVVAITFQKTPGDRLHHSKDGGRKFQGTVSVSR